MNKLTKSEFDDRMQAVARARKIFIPHITKNISIAFALYQEVLAEHKRDVFLSTMTSGDKMRTVMDSFVRPNCPDCGKVLYLRLINTPKGKANIHGYKSQWMCIQDDCSYEVYSQKTLNEWMKELDKKEECNG